MVYVLRYVTIGLSILLIGFIRVGYKGKNTGQDNLIKQPFLYFWGGILSSILFAIIVIIGSLLPTSSDSETMFGVVSVFTKLMIFSMMFV